MAYFPEYHNVDRGTLTNPEYIGDYEVPLVTKEDYEDLLKASEQARQQKVTKAEDTYKKLNNVKDQNKPGVVFSSPNLQKRFKDLQESFGINDAAYSAALNGDPYIMRKLESAYSSLSNSAEYWNMYKEDQYYKGFKKQIDDIKDPAMKSQAYASMVAYETGEPDPVTGKVLTAYDLNPGHYLPLDLEKDINEGLKTLMVPKEVTQEKDGYIQTVKQISLDKEKAKEWFTGYLSNPAVQRNLTAKGLGLNHKQEDGSNPFMLNENGQRWMANIIDSKTTPIDDVQSVKFNTKVYNERDSKAGGFILDDLAGASTIKTDYIERQGDQNVHKYKFTLDENLFYDQVNLKMKDPDFRKQMLEQGFIDESNTFTPAFKEALDVYKKKLTREEIKGHKNAPQARASSGGRKGSGSNGAANIKSAFEEAGLEYKGVGGIDLSKKVNYRVFQSNGKWWLRVGESDKNDRLLEEGKNYTVKKSEETGANKGDFFKSQHEKQFGAPAKSKWTK